MAEIVNLKTEQQIIDELDQLISLNLLPRIDTPEKRQQEIIRLKNQAARWYLNKTDWYVTRYIETNVAIPEDITNNRAAARAMITE